jgi:hypothetical protein
MHSYSHACPLHTIVKDIVYMPREGEQRYPKFSSEVSHFKKELRIFPFKSTFKIN